MENWRLLEEYLKDDQQMLKDDQQLSKDDQQLFEGRSLINSHLKDDQQMLVERSAAVRRTISSSLKDGQHLFE